MYFPFSDFFSSVFLSVLYTPVHHGPFFPFFSFLFLLFFFSFIYCERQSQSEILFCCVPFYFIFQLFKLFMFPFLVG